MCQYLPTGEFKFLSTWDLAEILRTGAEADYGFFLEVDLGYSPSIHEKLSDYPPAPVKKSIDKLSPFQQEILRDRVRTSLSPSPQKIEERLKQIAPPDATSSENESLRTILRVSMSPTDEEIETKLTEELSKPSGEKLIADLTPKNNYICHYRLLQKYVELGLEVIFLHCY